MSSDCKQTADPPGKTEAHAVSQDAPTAPRTQYVSPSGMYGSGVAEGVAGVPA